MIYIKGTNPTKNKTVYFRGYLGTFCTSWTETLNSTQILDLQTLDNAQKQLDTINFLKCSITNKEIMNNAIN